MSQRTVRDPYPSDLTDEQWAVLAPSLGQRSGPGRPPTVDLRAVVNALFYQARTGCQWGRAQPPAGGAGPGAAGAPPAAQRGDHRQPKREDDRGRRGAGLGWGE